MTPESKSWPAGRGQGAGPGRRLEVGSAGDARLRSGPSGPGVPFLGAAATALTDSGAAGGGRRGAGGAFL